MRRRRSAPPTRCRACARDRPTDLHELDMSATLLPDWPSIAAIAQALPSIAYIDVRCAWRAARPSPRLALSHGRRCVGCLRGPMGRSLNVLDPPHAAESAAESLARITRLSVNATAMEWIQVGWPCCSRGRGDCTAQRCTASAIMPAQRCRDGASAASVAVECICTISNGHSRNRHHPRGGALTALHPYSQIGIVASWMLRLEELHACRNSIERLPSVEPARSLLTALTTLNLGSNCIADWAEVCSLALLPRHAHAVCTRRAARPAARCSSA